MSGISHRQDWTGRFKLYDAANPHVYGQFKAFAYQLKNTGHKRASAALIFERMRWESLVRGSSEQGLPELKINNSYRSIMARKLVHEDPSMEGFFQMRAASSLGEHWAM